MAIVKANFPSGNQNFQIYLDYSYSQNTTANTTTITLKMGLYCVNSYASYTWHTNGATLARITYYNAGSSTASNQQSTGNGYDLRGHKAGDYVQLLSTSVTVTHASDGTCKAITLYGSCNCSNTGQGLGTVSTTFTPPRIPRASSFNSVPSAMTLGQAYTVTISPASTSFTHTVKITAGSRTLTKNLAAGVTSCTFSASETDLLYDQIPNSNSGNATVSLTNSVGLSATPRTITFTTVKTNCSPTFTGSGMTYSDSNSAVTSVTGNNAVIVSGQSQLRVTIPSSGKATARKSATMKKYTLTCGGKSAEAAWSNTSTVYLYLSGVTSKDYTVTAVDSRGNQTVVSKSVATFVNYTPPVINTLKATRTNGVGETVTLVFSGTIYSGSLGNVTNAATILSYKWRKSGATSWTTGGTSLTAATSCNQVIRGDISAGFTANQSFDLQLTFKDRLVTVTKEIVINSGVPVIDAYRSGTTVGVGIGKRWSQGALDVDGDIYQNNTKLIDLIKSNDLESRIKLSNGVMIQWGRKSLTTQSNAGYVLRLNEGFVDSNWALIASVNGGMTDPGNTANVQYTNSSGSCNVWFADKSGAPLANANVVLSYIAIGRWKN